MVQHQLGGGKAWPSRIPRREANLNCSAGSADEDPGQGQLPSGKTGGGHAQRPRRKGLETFHVCGTHNLHQRCRRKLHVFTDARCRRWRAPCPGGIQKSTRSAVPETSLQGSLDNTRQCGLGMPLPGTFSLYFLPSFPPSFLIPGSLQNRNRHKRQSHQCHNHHHHY